MCTIPPPPPPPPPEELVSSNSVKETKDVTDLIHILSAGVCEWASHEPSLWEACTSRHLCLSDPPFQYRYTHFNSIMQVGPTCGLVALAMMLKGEVTPDELLNITKLEGYSSNGEMLSCKNMVKLAQKAISLVEADITCTLKEGRLYSNEIIQELLDGAFLLVPYDADCNHYPCEKHGHTAHWALVTGVLVVEDPGGREYTSAPNNIHVLCRHGKSRFLSAWLLEDLDRSNQNLWEFSPKKRGDGLLYVIPEGGIGGENGLRNQFLLFKRF